MHETILFVDDDRTLLDFLEGTFAGRGVRVLTAGQGSEAIEIISRQPVAVLVTDNNMPRMGGLELLARVGEISPDTVKIMMTAYADLPTVMSAINNGDVYRFVQKPWKKGEMVRAVKDGIRRYRVLQSLKNDDEFILHSLAQTIELKDALTKGHCDRVANFALRIAEHLGLADDTKAEIKYGSWLHDCGKIGVPEAILNASRPLTEDEFAIVMKHPVWGVEVVRKANLSVIVQNIVLCHHERFDGKGYPAGLKGNDIPIESRIVAAADVYDALMTDRPYRKGYLQKETLALMAEMRGTALDPEIVDILVRQVCEGQ